MKDQSTELNNPTFEPTSELLLASAPTKEREILDRFLAEREIRKIQAEQARAQNSGGKAEQLESEADMLWRMASHLTEIGQEFVRAAVENVHPSFDPDNESAWTPPEKEQVEWAMNTAANMPPSVILSRTQEHRRAMLHRFAVNNGRAGASELGLNQKRDIIALDLLETKLRSFMPTKSL